MSGLDSRLLPFNSREWMVANNGFKHADNLDRAVSDGRTDLVFAAARAMSGNSSRSAAVTPLYNLRWHSIPIQVSPNTPPIRNSDILDQDFSWNQIASALLQMSPRKAPGDDGITTAFYQAALYMPANTQEGVPPTPFARALLRAGFRKREECVGQVVSLVDIIQRRQNAGINTHVLFIDIRKAFDTVPVGALLWKLQNMGFPRRTLVFLKALYTSSSARARAGSLLSDPFPVQRGVRQGCPLSGLLFNLFINDILDGVAPITVPGLSRDTNPIRGLMYADDVAVFANSEQSLLAASTAIEQWANRWEMQFGVTKCGIISFTGHLAPRLDNPLDIRLHGQLVSRVESYKYLGVLINSKGSHGKGKPAPSGAFTHRIREDGEIFSGSVRMRSTDSDRSIRATPKKARDASPPPQDDLWVVVKNLSQQVAAQQAEMDALRNAIALQQKATANLEKILGNMASQAASTSEATQAALAAILARLEVGPVVPQVVVVDDYPPLPQTGAIPKRKTMATKPILTTTTTTATDTTTTTDQLVKNTRFADAVKRRPTHQQLVERQPDFRKAGAAAWLALKRETSIPAHSAPKVELSSGLRLIYASGFPYAKPGDLRKAIQGARIRTSASFKAWTPRSEAADKDKLAAILSFAAKTVTTIQRSPDVKARSFFRSLLASIGGKTLEAATAEATKIWVQTPSFSISTMEIVPKESLPVKKATEQEPAAPAVDPPLDMAAEVTSAIQDDGVAPTVTPIADVEMSVSISYLRSILAPILGHQMEHVSKIDRRTTKHGARFRITVPEDRQRNIIQRLERQSKQTHWCIRQNYRHRRPDQPRPTAPPPPLSRQILAVNVANISNKRPAIRHIVRNTRLWAISETCITSSKFRFTVPEFDVIQHPATGPGRRGIALGIPSCFGGHEHGSEVGTMILAKVLNFTPECMWIVGSVDVGHSGATTNYSRREAFASIRQALDRVVPFDNNHPVLIFGDWNTDPQRLQRIVHSWGHGLTVMRFSGSQITRLSTVHGRRHSQTAVADHFVIRTSIRAEAQGQPPAPRAPTISRHHCLEATDRIATSNYWDVLADGASDDTDTDTDIHRLTSQFLESANAVADNLSLRLSPPATRSNRRLLSGTTKRAILASNTARQAFIAAATNTDPDPVQCNTLRDGWSRLKATATQLERVDGRKQWVKHADNLDRAVSDGRTDLVFAAARAMSGNSSRSAAVTPLYNSDGVVQYDPTSILRVMQGHYGSLAADTTGHSLDLQYWHDRQPIQVSHDTPLIIRNSDILDQDFSWNQIAAALLQMSPRKAPGDDGITTAFYQAALYMPADTQEGVPPTPFARALLRVCGQVFASATIPRAWLCASIVSIDKKDGDPLNPGDKRGIALINVGLKLVCKVLQMRIERFVDTNQPAVLRTGWVPQARRAFDTVPVGALLWKLQNMGFPRRTLVFLKALYTSSSARARAGSLLSDPFPVQRGVRQGCPLSGLLFNLFINDILDGVAPITVPGLPRDTNPIRGLMYADDVAVFADSEQSLLAASTAIEQWANRWEMQFGVAKCGIISFTGHLAPRLDNPLDIRLHGQLVSRVESYKYLVTPCTTANDDQQGYPTVHWCPDSRLPSDPFWLKLGLGSLLTRSLVSRVRLLERSVTKRTPINAICSGTDNDVFTLNVQGAVGKIPALVLVSSDQTAIQEQILADTTRSNQRQSSNDTRLHLMETLQTCGDSASLQKYVTRQFLDTSGFFKDPSFDQSREHGTRYLMLARMDALWTARKAIQIGILVDTHPFSADHCILCDQQLLSTSICSSRGGV
ncbi:hypothetical protein BASA83_010709 [Batrachochytrium salamandrivorans]|nr:hypothetical protein BASA83_010709 [Batrachochytrium salamandrivorans]